MLVDYVGHYENLAHEFSAICGKLGLGDIELPRKNKSRNKIRHYGEYYTAPARDLVAERFRKDIDLFGYNFQDGTSGSARSE